MDLYIKNMVCPRCIMAVERILKDNQMHYSGISLGKVVLTKEPSKVQFDSLSTDLAKVGFELLADHKKKQIEKVKNLLIEKIQSAEIEEHLTLSEFLSKKLNKQYSQFSRLFSEVEGVTIEQYFILQKIEKVKEWIAYDELTLSEIAWKLGYSSVAHLSGQFKKITGLTPSDFKKTGISHRKSLDQVQKRK